MKKKNLATAMAAAMAFGGVAPVVANANEPQGRIVEDGTVENGGKLDVALANGRVTTTKTYLEIYNTNFTDKTSDDKLVGDYEILYSEKAIPAEIKTEAEANAYKFIVSTQKTNLTDAEKKEIATEKTDLEDTITFIKDMVEKGFYELDGKVVDQPNLTTGSTAKIVNLKPTKAGIEAGRTQNLKYTFNGVAIEAKQEVEVNITFPEDGEINVTAITSGATVIDKQGVEELNKFVYDLNMNKENIIVEQKNSGLDNLEIIVYKKTEDNKKGIELGRAIITNFKEFKAKKFEGFVDIANMVGFDELGLPEISYAKDAIINALASGEMTGDERGIRAKDSITRAEFAKLVCTMLDVTPLTEEALAKLTEKDKFADVDVKSWEAPYVYALKTNDIVSGDGDGTFRPSASISRQEVATMIVAAKKGSKVDVHKSTNGDAVDSKTKFNDDASIALWADGAVKVLQESGVSKGDENNNFNPENNIIRAEAIIMLTRSKTELNKANISPETTTGTQAGYTK